MIFVAFFAAYAVGVVVGILVGVIWVAPDRWFNGPKQ